MDIKQLKEYFHQSLERIYDYQERNAIFFLLMEELTGRDKLYFIANPSFSPEEYILKKTEQAIKRLQKHEPLQYILGHAWFYGLKFKVDPNVLIPRPETEELVQWALYDIACDKENFRVLDIGTGSGCIAISIKKNRPAAETWAMDVSAGALDVAKFNAAENNTEINFIQDDILKPALKTDFDIIISNPPYVTREQKQQMKQNVLAYEPHIALFAGDEGGMQFYEAIRDYTDKNLKPGGCLYLEINEEKAIETAGLFSERHTYLEPETRKDLQGKSRMMKICRKPWD